MLRSCVTCYTAALHVTQLSYMLRSWVTCYAAELHVTQLRYICYAAELMSHVNMSQLLNGIIIKISQLWTAGREWDLLIRWFPPHTTMQSKKWRNKENGGRRKETGKLRQTSSFNLVFMYNDVSLRPVVQICSLIQFFGCNIVSYWTVFAQCPVLWLAVVVARVRFWELKTQPQARQL